MKLLLKIFLATSFLTLASCYPQKLMDKISDAKKLEINNHKFINRPLKYVLRQIKPEIKFVYGNPENEWAGANGGTSLTFYFNDKQEAKKRVSRNDIPTNIIIRFNLEPINNRKLLPKDGLNEWTHKETKEYGDMIIRSIEVSGEN